MILKNRGCKVARLWRLNKSLFFQHSDFSIVIAQNGLQNGLGILTQRGSAAPDSTRRLGHLRHHAEGCDFGNGASECYGASAVFQQMRRFSFAFPGQMCYTARWKEGAGSCMTN